MVVSDNSYPSYLFYISIFVAFRCLVHNTCRFFSGVSLPPDFPGDPHLKIPAKLRETFKGVRSDFEQRLRSEQGIVSNRFLLLTYCHCEVAVMITVMYMMLKTVMMLAVMFCYFISLFLLHSGVLECDFVIDSVSICLSIRPSLCDALVITESE